jgi:C4-type Zn-finger protein
MAPYSVKRCPNCHDDFWVTISHPSPQAKELPITAYCALCGYALRGWRLIVGGKRAPEVLSVEAKGAKAMTRQLARQ